IVDTNKGGVIASVMGIRVFIPASQTGLPRDAAFDSMLKTTHKMRITEINKQRRRVVGSIKVLAAEMRREAAAKIWETIEVGAEYTGVVKSFTSYGAFVDIGGVDGMIHISELSWNRVKHPSEVLTIGQEVSVYVIALDTEKKKISLGYRRAEDNPWTKFESNFQKGDVAKVKIVKFMPFGAFAEVIPGVDGLIHISQIAADRRIGKPEEALTLGEEVEAKITDIDSEKKKISLSIKALQVPAAEEETAE
ncbi:MAG: S1 RNA-binding domain-containing protein, partial [Clostridia bacterium]|nr:S1 RNA-binding domain-containing protein [Clostridia bacterium]